MKEEILGIYMKSCFGKKMKHFIQHEARQWKYHGLIWMVPENSIEDCQVSIHELNLKMILTTEFKL